VRNKKHLSDDEVSRIFADTDSLTRTLQAGIYVALLKHKQAGNPVCEWRDNKVVWIPPECIPVNPRKDFDEN